MNETTNIVYLNVDLIVYLDIVTKIMSNNLGNRKVTNIRRKVVGRSSSSSGVRTQARFFLHSSEVNSALRLCAPSGLAG